VGDTELRVGFEVTRELVTRNARYDERDSRTECRDDRDGTNLVPAEVRDLERIFGEQLLVAHGFGYCRREIGSRCHDGVFGNFDVRLVHVFGAELERGLFVDERGLFADERGFFANERGFFADERGLLADERGFFADESGLFADESGLFANECGFFANGLGFTPDAEARSFADPELLLQQ
jgi:hypothetical protein